MELSPARRRYHQELIRQWERLPDEQLKEQLCESITMTGDAHWELAKAIYPMIQDRTLTDRIKRILLGVASDVSIEKMSLEVNGRAVEVCALLSFSKTRETILDLIKKIGEPSSLKDPTYLPYLNTAIKELQLREAIKFLCDELEVIPKLKEPRDEYLWCYRSAIWALEVIDPNLARSYINKFELYPVYRALHEWNDLTYDELREEIKKNISGWGMAASSSHLNFISEFYKEIENIELKKRVDKVLIELMGEIKKDVGGRAIYICSTLRLEHSRDKILEILGKTDAIFKTIKETSKAIEWSTCITYLMELNNAIGLLNVDDAKAKEFLIKQLPTLKSAVPQPMTKEYYLYYQSAPAALSALRKIDPELAKGYE